MYNLICQHDVYCVSEMKAAGMSEKSTRVRSAGPNPSLQTIRMIEEAIKAAKTYPSKNRLRLSLPKQIQYASFNAVLAYLEDSNKIMYDKDGSIIWIFADNPELKKLLQSSTKLR